jgi:hypothetical protein
MKPFLKWAGGKHRLSEKITTVLPKGKRLIEPFVGSGAVFLNADYDSYLLADANADLIDLFNHVKHQVYAFIEQAEALFTDEHNQELRFYELRDHQLHPAFVAISCHTNESGGLDAAEHADLKAQVLANQGTIASLTELLPPAVAALMTQPWFKTYAIPTTALSVDAPAGTLQGAVCMVVRGSTGLFKGFIQRLRLTTGFVSKKTIILRIVMKNNNANNASNANNHVPINIYSSNAAPQSSLLNTQLVDEAQKLVHSDFFYCDVDMTHLPNANASEKRVAPELLAMLLDAFMTHPPKGVGYLMRFRNVLVKPLGLRTASLGCPVSSLMGKADAGLFNNRFPVLAQQLSAEYAQVILGANDKHLKFRSCIAVQQLQTGKWQISLGTRVVYNNRFGQF